MTRIQALKYSMVHIVIILLGAFIAFKFWWTNGDGRFMGIIAFLLVGLGAFFLSFSLTRIIIPTKTDFGFMTIADETQFNILKNTIGNTKARFIHVSYISLFFIIFSATVYGLLAALDRYEEYQLRTYGRTQKVRIKDINHKGKGNPYAFFDFYLDGNKYTNNLSHNNYSEGDSAIIIFSTNDPDIVKWADDFNANED